MKIIYIDKERERDSEFIMNNLKELKKYENNNEKRRLIFVSFYNIYKKFIYIYFKSTFLFILFFIIYYII